jgi:hypothetical protein
MKMVENSKMLKLLRQTIILLTINLSSQTINNKDFKLYDILHKIQTIIEHFSKKKFDFSKSKNYTNIVKCVVESMAILKRVEKYVERFFNSKTIKQIKEFTINIVNDEKKRN